LILDEATSALDSESERSIQETIKTLQEEFTIIIVTHKLSAVRSADRIYVLDKGSVCESGSYEELLGQKGRLYEFDLLQK
jgi:ABC-type multidrug transport system fused ATPase/permease subunit